MPHNLKNRLQKLKNDHNTGIKLKENNTYVIWHYQKQHKNGLITYSIFKDTCMYVFSSL